MSFAKKALKKVWKPIKKVVKKVWKPALIIGATFFTAGLATAGFGAFSGATSIGGFLGAVGKTTAMGGQALAGSIGLGKGVSAGMATTATGAAIPGVQAGTTLGTGILAQNMGFAGGTSSMYGPSPSGTSGIAPWAPSAVEKSASNSNFFNSFTKGVGGIFEGDMGKYMLAQGIMSGAQSYMQQRQYDQEQKRLKRSNFYGGPMRGGDSESGLGFPTYGQQGQQEEQQAPAMQQPQNPGQPAPPGQAPASPSLLGSNILQQGQQILPSIFQPGNLDLAGPQHG